MLKKNNDKILEDLNSVKISLINKDDEIKRLKEKYGEDPFPWDENLFKRIPNILKKIERAKLSKNYMFYPYFEKDILNLNKKNFLL